MQEEQPAVDKAALNASLEYTVTVLVQVKAPSVHTPVRVPVAVGVPLRVYVTVCVPLAAMVALLGETEATLIPALAPDSTKSPVAKLKLADVLAGLLMVTVKVVPDKAVLWV